MSRLFLRPLADSSIVPQNIGGFCATLIDFAEDAR
jgi:hypothetical protein